MVDWERNAARLRDDALPVGRDVPERPTVSAAAVDAVALMDALDIEEAVLAGFDWAARSGRI